MAFWSLARRKQRRFAELSPQERRLLYHAAVLLPVVVVGRRLLSYKRLQVLIARLMPFETSVRVSQQTGLVAAQRSAYIVKIAAHNGLTRANCLEQSLVLWGLLRRQGIDGNVVIGARKVEGHFEAHAWVEVQGVVLNGSADVGERFAMLIETQHVPEQRAV